MFIFLKQPLLYLINPPSPPPQQVLVNTPKCLFFCPNAVLQISGKRCSRNDEMRRLASSVKMNGFFRTNTFNIPNTSVPFGGLSEFSAASSLQAENSVARGQDILMKIFRESIIMSDLQQTCRKGSHVRSCRVFSPNSVKHKIGVCYVGYVMSCQPRARWQHPVMHNAREFENSFTLQSTG